MNQTFTYDAMNLDNSYEFHSGPSQDFTLFGASSAQATSSGDMFPIITGESSWGTLDQLGASFGSHLEMSNTPSLPAGTTNQALADAAAPARS